MLCHNYKSKELIYLIVGVIVGFGIGTTISGQSHRPHMSASIRENIKTDGKKEK